MKRTSREVHAGSLIIFNRIDDAGMHLWRVNTDGTGLRQLTSGVGEPISGVSRDGRLAVIGYFGQPRTFAVICTEDGRELRKDEDVHGMLGLSPDGNSLLIGHFERDERGLARTVWQLVPSQGGSPTATLRFPAQAFDFAWGADGQFVSFQERSDPAWNVFRQPLSGGAPQAVPHFTTNRIVGHKWSGDGNRLAVLVRVGKIGRRTIAALS